ncbi:hypothetical protein Tco_0717491 [Tanacetum coccineum]
MGDKNPNRTLGDYSKPSHEGYRNTIELPVGNNVVPLQSDTIRGPHDTQYCMEDPEQAFVEYASLRTDEAGGHEEKGNLGNINSNPHPQPDPLASITTEQVQKLNLMLESLGLVPQSSNTKFVCTKEDDGEILFIEIIRDDDEPQNESPNEGEGTTTEGPTVEYFDMFPTRDELTYHKKLNPREDANGGISNFTGRIKGMHVFIGNFTYVVDFVIVEDISLIIDPRLSQVVLGRPFIEISNIPHDLPEGVVRFTNEDDEVSYKMPHKIEQYNSLSNLEKEHTKSVYLRNDEDKRNGVDYVMSKILGFYKECLELGPEYVTGLDDEGEVT